MKEDPPRYAPGRVRDAIMQVLALTSRPLSVKEIEDRVERVIGPTPTSSVRSYLRLNTPELFVRESRGFYSTQGLTAGGVQREFAETQAWREPQRIGNAALFHADCFDWLEEREDQSIHAVVTDPPYGLYEYSPEQQTKLRNGKGGVWRIPPSFDGHVRSPLPRPLSNWSTCGRSSSSGRDCCCLNSSPALRWSWPPTPSCPISCQRPWRMRVSNGAAKSSDSR